jgi:energy-coupling factor transporter ATP-binding protein EcfA2
VILFQDYSWQYTGRVSPTLVNINLQINAGECVLLSGASGSGKSTLGLAMGCLLEGRLEGKCTGTLFLAGVDVTHATPEKASPIVALVQQNPELNFATQCVEEELAFALENDCLPREVIHRRVNRMLNLFRIGDLRDRQLRELSEGQKQRVAIASACITEPQVLFLDEPSSSLDPDGLEDLLGLLQQLKSDHGMALVIAEHRVGLYEALCPRHIVLVRGRIAPAPTDQTPWSDILSAVKPCAHEPGDLTASVQELVVRRGESTVLKGISFDLRAGEVVALMGPNGSGKSSLLLALLGLIPIHSGGITLHGEPVHARSTYALARRTGLVFQNPDHQLFADSVWKEAFFACENFGDSEGVMERAERGLTQAGLGLLRNQHPYCLSFGQKRRLNVLASSLHNIRLLLLDEPFVGQDRPNSCWLVQMIRQLAQDGVAVVIVVHDPEMAALCCDRQIFLKAGCLEIDAPSDQAWAIHLDRGNPQYVPRAWGTQRA